MEEALRALLLADAAVADLVGTRVTWAMRPQGSDLPAIVLWLISGREESHFQGPDHVADSLVQIDCWAATYGAAKRVARAAQAALAGYRDTGDSPPGIFQGLFVEAARDAVDDAQPAPLYRTSLDVRAWTTAA